MTTQESKLSILKKLKWLCSGAVIFGFITSAGGNILHAVEGYGDRPWGILTVSIILAALIPLIFGFMFEIASRIFFRKEAHIVMKLIAFTGAAGISGITAWNSYFHQRDAFSHFGDHTQAFLLPLAIDGLMIVGSVYLIELGFQIRDLEAAIAGVAVKTSRKSEAPKDTKKGDPAKVKIAQILAKSPSLKPVDVAKLAGTSYNYAYSVMKELQRELEPETV